MDATALLGTLQSLVPAASLEAIPAVDCPTLIVPREHIVDTCRALRDTPSLNFAVLLDVTAVDYHPREPRYQVVYHLVSVGEGPGRGAVRLRLKVPVAAEPARLPTVSGVYPNANWGEREVFDLFGIEFEGHPDLRRILMPEDWEGHPLRRDYPVQVKVPVKIHESLQMSEEEFVANIQRQRRTSPGAERPH